jgi:iron(III) transport system substrate-binding protein
LFSAGAFACALLYSAASLAQATAPEWSKVLAAARKEGKVVFYTSLPPAGFDRVVAGWKKAYPDIPMEATRGVTAQLLPRFENERASGSDGGDVWLTAEKGMVSDLAKEGRLLKPVGPGLAGWPPEALVAGAGLLPGREPFVIAYNTNLVPVALKGYSDLLRPELKGNIGTSLMVATTVVAFYDLVERSQPPEFMAKLAAQNPKFYNGGTPTAQAVAAGEVAVCVLCQPTAVTPLIKTGAPIAMAFPNPAYGYDWAGGAFAWTKRPNAALVLVDWLMSVDGQTVWHGAGETASPRAGIPGSLSYASVTPWDPSRYPPDVVKKYTDRWNSIFKK